MWKIEPEESKLRASEMYASGIFGRHRHFPDAAPVLRALAARFDLVVLTSRRVIAKEETRVWLDRHFAGLFPEVHFSGIWERTDNDPHLLTKADVCLELGLDYLIDDQLKHVVGAAEVGVEAVLFGDYPWNQTDELPNGAHRCANWAEVSEYFARVKAGATQYE
jgi:hypothetical protein